MGSGLSAVSTIRLGLFPHLGMVSKREGGGYGLRSPKTQTSGELRSNLFIAPKTGALIASLYEMIKPMVTFAWALVLGERKEETFRQIRSRPNNYIYHPHV